MPAVEGGMIRNGIAVKTGEQAQRDAVADAFCQLPVVPLLDPHQNPGPQRPARQSVRVVWLESKSPDRTTIIASRLGQVFFPG